MATLDEVEPPLARGRCSGATLTAGRRCEPRSSVSHGVAKTPSPASRWPGRACSSDGFGEQAPLSSGPGIARARPRSSDRALLAVERNSLLSLLWGFIIHSLVSRLEPVPAGEDVAPALGQHMAAGRTRASIRAALSSLQPADARVARAILADPAAVVYLTVTEVAARAETSASTVVRACQELGFRGFHDLKLALARDLGAATVGGRDIDEGDAPGDVLRKVLASDAEAIGGSLATIDEAAFGKAVDALEKASSVLFVGVGTSAPLAQDAAYRFLTIGVDARAPADVHVQHVAARLLRAGDVCFAISHTGSTRETVEEVSAAREAGATTIALSSFFRSPLAEVAEIVLVAGGTEHSFRIEAMASRIGHLSVLDALFVALALRRPERSRVALEEVGRTLSEHRF